LKKYLLEETYEVLDAIDARDWDGLADELGDLLLQPVFQAQIAAEGGRFSIGDALDAINEKLVRRHPHVFGSAEARTADEVKHRWDRIKAEEKKARGLESPNLLHTVPRSLPALAEAQDIGSKVAKVGFDWPEISQVYDKLSEEIQELHHARDAAHREEEIGDLLFVAVNLARHLGVDAEQALRKANAKFRRRFEFVENALASDGVPLGEATLDQMEEKWRIAKHAV
jgi:MazG family protein